MHIEYINENEKKKKWRKNFNRTSAGVVNRHRRFFLCLLTTNFVVFFCSVVVASLFGSVCYCRLHSEKKKETYILGDAWINAFYRCFCFVQLEGRTNIYIFIWNNVEFPQKYRNSETKFYLHIMHQYLICVVLYCNWWAL